MTINALPLRDDHRLLCPNCGDEHTWVNKVDVSSSSGSGLRVIASGEDDASIVKAQPLRATANGRRYEVVLYIGCEMCEQESSLALIQHKGETEVVRSWDDEA
ncbi:hypothetical protein [Pseudoclavibacter sp. RFBA6]|uniref:hypothetical protein n=1 Tax=Pseudoclavibacter sp. RFBA6 TaxID=2080573 RepID=UPI000CE8B00A|nr:hypothetical protein [Pseudoclavibacter sp. RFBA6]PPG38022.1 hypothetical protein C5C17_15315 [Pseudoclavibacter sp. RFBA6]